MSTITDITAKKRMREYMAMFWELVDKDAKSGCWMWKGETGQYTAPGTGKKYQYGCFFRHPDNAQRVGVTYAHRLTWALKYRMSLRDVPRLQRTCGRTMCINPEHWAQATLHPSTQLRELRARTKAYRNLLRKFAQS
jgi:hypothetical protein